MENIFNSLMGWHLNKIGISDDNIIKVFRHCIEATVDMYMHISDNLKPTPAKSHYLFNLRDVSRVIQGLQLINKGQISDDKKVILILYL